MKRHRLKGKNRLLLLPAAAPHVLPAPTSETCVGYLMDEGGRSGVVGDRRDRINNRSKRDLKEGVKDEKEMRQTREHIEKNRPKS